MATKYDVLIIGGAGNMGSGLVQRLSRAGVRIAVIDPDRSRVERLLKDPLVGAVTEAFPSCACALEALKRPALIFSIVSHDLIPALIKQLVEAGARPGDLLLDMGNCHWQQTMELAQSHSGAIALADCPLSGGPRGAREGPTVIFGGAPEQWEVVRPILTTLAAVHTDGQSCAAHVGPVGSAHFVKAAIHNAIEYAVIQALADGFQVWQEMLGLDGPGYADLLESTERLPLDCFLRDAACQALRQKHPDKPGILLLDDIEDRAGQKGTGLWAAQESLRLGYPFNGVIDAVQARGLSGCSQLRAELSARFPKAASRPKAAPEKYFSLITDALCGAILTAHAQGFGALFHASHAWKKDLDWSFDAGRIAAIFRSGCILKGRLMDVVTDIYRAKPDQTNLLTDPRLADELAQALPGWRRLASECLRCEIQPPGVAGMLPFLDSARTCPGPQRLCQAVRDYFGWHGFKLKGRPGTWHLTWEADQRKLIAI